MIVFDEDYRNQYRKLMAESKEYKNALDEDQRKRLIDFMFKETENGEQVLRVIYSLEETLKNYVKTSLYLG